MPHCLLGLRAIDHLSARTLHFFLALIIAVCGVVTGLTGEAFAGKDFLDPAWDAPAAPGSAIALVGKHVVIGGVTLAAYDARSGRQEWEVSSDRLSEIRALVAHHHRVFAVGTTAGLSEQRDLFVGAFDPKTGAQLWHDTVDYASGIESGHAATAESGRVFVVGQSAHPTDQGRVKAFIRAYDARTGARLWDDLVDLFPFAVDYLAATEADGLGLVYLVAGGTQGTSIGSTFVIRAYEAESGRLKWQNQLASSDGATVVAADRNLVFTGGTVGSNLGFLVRAYDRRDGRVVWEDSFFGGDLNLVTGIAVHRGRLFVTGFSLILNPAPPPDELPNNGSFVKAYDPATGTVLWQQTPFDLGRGFINRALVASGRSLFVGGASFPDQFSSGLFSIRALDPETGALEAEDVLEDAPGSSVRSLAARRGLLIAVSGLPNPDGTTEFDIRAYETEHHADHRKARLIRRIREELQSRFGERDEFLELLERFRHNGERAAARP
jgi:hypothetical protein